MSRALNQAVLETVQAAIPMSDWDQRSALGIARRSLEPTARRQATDPMCRQQYARRDALADALIEAIKDAKPDEAIKALAAARVWVDKPFRQKPTMTGAPILKPKEAKKARSQAES